MAPDPQPASRERRTQRERRSEAETKLITSAMELIADQGAERTSLAQIGERAGFSRGIVNHHFGTKATLIQRLVSDAQGHFWESVAADVRAAGREAVLVVADEYLRALTDPTPAVRAFLVMWAEAAGAGRDLRPSLAAGDRRFRSTIRDLVNRGIVDGSIRADVHPGSFAAGLVGQLRGLGLAVLVDPGAFDLDQMRPDLLNEISAVLTPTTPRRRTPPAEPPARPQSLR